MKIVVIGGTGLVGSKLVTKRVFTKSDRLICVLKLPIKEQKFFAILINIPKNFCSFIGNL